MFTQEQGKIVQNTFAIITTQKNGTPMSVNEIAENVATPFYKRLFEIDPSLAKYFINVHDTSCKFAAILKTLIDSLGKNDTTNEIVELGKRHMKYAHQGGFIINAKNFNDVGSALIETIELRLKESEYKFDTNEAVGIHQAWEDLYNTIVGIMMPKIIN